MFVNGYERIGFIEYFTLWTDLYLHNPVVCHRSYNI